MAGLSGTSESLPATPAMFPKPLAALSFLATLAGMAVAQGTSELVVVDFYTGVHYDPPEAWHTGTNEACQTVDHFTAEVNASATINFVGECAVFRIMYGDPHGFAFAAQAIASR